MRKRHFSFLVFLCAALVLVLSGWREKASPVVDPVMPINLTDLFDSGWIGNVVYQLPLNAPELALPSEFESSAVIGETTGTTGTSTTGSTELPGLWCVGVKNSDAAAVTIVEDAMRSGGVKDFKESSTVTASVRYKNISPGEHFEVTTYSNPSTQVISVYLEYTTGYTDPDGHNHVTHRIWKRPITLDWRQLDAVSVDSRKMYGPPYATGIQGLDANSPPRPVNFYGAIHKGGLFLGKMPATTMDQSGVARIQMYGLVPTSTNAVKWNVSLMSLSNASVGAVGDVYLSTVTSADSSYSVLPTVVTWTSRWVTAGMLASHTGALAPGTRLNFKGDPDESGFPTKFNLFQQDESLTSAAWTYFASPAFGTSQPGYLTACPDLWLLRYELPGDSFYSWSEIIG